MTDTDQLAREKITKDVSHNYFVEAGAGSGKTHSLVERMVTMVESGIDIRSICAITFTKAAAGEFYARFYRRLNERLSESSDHEAKRNLENAIENIDLCFMNTIDSFANRILSEHPAAAGIPSDSSVRSDAEIRGVYTREYSRIAKGEYGAELQTKYQHFRKQVRNPQLIFMNGMRTLEACRDYEQVFSPHPAESVDGWLASEKQTILDFLSYIEKHPQLILSGKDYEAKFSACLNDKGYLAGSWERNPDAVLRALGNLKDFRVLPDKELLARFGGVLEEKKKRNPNPAHFRFTLPERVIRRMKNSAFSIAMDFLTSAYQAITETRRNKGELVYSDYLVYLRDMLKQDITTGGKLIRHISQRHRYFLIDEFQDTDPVQAEIFFYLAAENPVEDWKLCVPRPGSLFIVGDPKQSIYRFRNADIGSYKTVRSLFRKEEILQLSRNFRSTKELCGWFNQTFTGLLPEDTEIQSRYPEIPAEENRQLQNCLGGVYTYPSVTNESKSQELYDAAQVAKIIHRMVQHPTIRIQTNKKALPRPIEYRDFMVITPSKAPIREIVRKLEERGIPGRIEGSVSFRSCEALVMTARLFSALANPRDAGAVYGALLSGFFPTSEDDVISFRNDGGRLSLFYQPKGQENPVLNALTELRELLYQIRDSSPVSALLKMTEKTRIFERVSAENLESWYYALELLRSAESSHGITSLQEAAVYLNDLAANRTDLERCLSLSSEENKVHIANLHKVKGLEAPIVILAHPSGRKPASVRHTRETETGKKCWLFSIDDGGMNSAFSTDEHSGEKAAEDAIQEAEQIRNLYVAATRARDVLIIAEFQKIESRDRDMNPWKALLDTANRGSIFDLIPDGEEPSIAEKEKVPAAELYEQGKAESVLAEKDSSLQKTMEIRRPSDIRIKAKTASEDELEDRTTEEIQSRKKPNRALVGTIVHRLMEILVFSKNTVDLGSTVDEILSDYDIQDGNYRKILLSVGGRMRTGGFEQTNGTPADLLAELDAAEEVYCELPFCWKPADAEPPVLWNGVIDLLYRKNGSWHIVDYKTNADPDDLDEKYREQLTAYRRALQDFGIEADTTVYHIKV